MEVGGDGHLLRACLLDGHIGTFLASPAPVGLELSCFAPRCRVKSFRDSPTSCTSESEGVLARQMFSDDTQAKQISQFFVQIKRSTAREPGMARFVVSALFLLSIWMSFPTPARAHGARSRPSAEASSVDPRSTHAQEELDRRIGAVEGRISEFQNRIATLPTPVQRHGSDGAALFLFGAFLRLVGPEYQPERLVMVLPGTRL